MNSRIKDLTNKTFGYLMVKSFSHIKKRITYWLCECICGKTKIILGTDLTRGKTKSCGCKKAELQINTNLAKYGVISTALFPEIKAKQKATLMKNFGVEYPGQSLEIQNKMKQTSIKKYGCACPLQNQEVHQKTIQTNLKLYGVEHPSQNAEIALKQAKAMNGCRTLYHWKTNEELICIGSYEAKVIEKWNLNKINFVWQTEIFKMPGGRTYRPDAYLSDLDIWVEIKGYFRGDAEEKWEWFHAEYPNSELWNEDKLIEMEIL